LHAADGLGGTSFTGLVTTPADLSATLSYSPTDVMLNLTATMGAAGGLNRNQQNVANALNTSFNTGAALPLNFFNLFDLTGANLANALTRLDGEVAVYAQRGAFNLMSEFLGVMLDPFVDGRGGSGWPGIASVAPQQASFPPGLGADDSAPAAVPIPASFDQRWTAWSAGYGGGNIINGDAAVGSPDTTAFTYGFALGLDYRATPDTVFGVALAGGGTAWSLAQGLGSGHSDAVQTGVYGATRFGPAYLAAALAFTDHIVSTSRTSFAVDQLSASFNAQSYGARLEAGYRFGTPEMGIAPYVALQAQDFHTPSYSESDPGSGGFGLAYNAMSASDTRGEVGARFNALVDEYVLLRARLAWAQDWASISAVQAQFQSLPGASFAVNGAPLPTGSALLSLAAELRLTPELVLLAKLDAEYASTSQTYAASGALRLTW